MNVTAAFHVRLLGPPAIECGGKAARVDTRKAIALLALLAVERRSHARASLAALLWPESDDAHGRGALRRTMHALSRVLPEGSLVTTQDQIELADKPGLFIDVAVFSGAYHDCAAQPSPCDICADRLADAVALYRDDFLSGFTLKDSVEFDDWQFFQTESFRRQHSSLLDAHLRCLRLANDHERAVESALNWARFDPLDEKPQAALMELLAGGGLRVAAMRQYETFRTQLARELDAEPSARLSGLYEDIRAGRWRGEASGTPTIGAATEAHEGASAAPVSDRHPATVLALRLTGTPRADDAATRLMSALYGTALRYGGRIEHQSGTSVLVVFGRSVTRENAPEFAVRAAIEAKTAGSRIGQSLAAGISSGLIDVPSHPEQPGSRGVAGHTVHEALRLAALAAAEEIVVSEATFRATRATVRYSTRRSRAGAPRVWHAQALHDDPSRNRGVGGLQAALVGRQSELERLQEAIAAVRGGAARVITVTGTAGVGKSRLIGEALRPASSGPGPEITVLRGRCLDLGVAAGYWPFLDMLRSHLSLPPQLDPAGVEQRIGEALTELHRRGLLADSDCDEMSARFVRLLSAGAEGADPQAARTAAFRAITKYLTSLARIRPLVLVLEDLHWADALSLELISYMMEVLRQATGTAVPIGLICIYRPDPAHRCRHLSATARRKCPDEYVDIQLEELSDPECRTMVQRLLGGDPVPEEMASFVVERAQGNPFYVEEVTRSLIDRGVLVRRKRGWVATGDTPSLLVPQSVESVIRANTDRLSASVQRVLRCASILGRVFDTSILTGMLGEQTDVESALLQLEDLAFVQEERTVPRREYAFRHVLTREAVYRGIPESQLRTLHGRAAEELRRALGDRLDPYLEQVAHHYEVAGTEPLAVRFLIESGRKAIRTSDNEGAIALLERGLEIVRTWPLGEERRQRELEILVTLGVPITATTGYGSEATSGVYQRANELADPANRPTLTFAAVFGLLRYTLIRGNISRAIDLSQRLVSMSAESASAPELLEAKRAFGCALIHNGRIREGEQVLRDGYALYDPDAHRSNAYLYGHDPATTFLTYLALVEWLQGYPHRAITTQERLRSLLRDSTHRASIVYSLGFGSLVRVFCGRVAEVLEMTGRGISLSGEGHLLMFGSISRAFHGWALTESGRRDEGIEEIRQGIRGMEAAGCFFVRSMIRSMLADVYLEDGALEVARRELDTAMGEIQGGERFFAPEIYRVRSLLAHASGHTAEARALLDRSAETARSMSALSYELRTAMSRMEIERAAGRSDGNLARAASDLRSVYDRFTEGFDTEDLRKAATLLET